jgi:hypothetical protein
MFKSHAARCSCIGLIVGLASASLGQPAYQVLVDSNDALGSASSWPLPLLGAHHIDGGTAYCIVRGKIFDSPIDDDDVWGSQITMVENINRTPATTLLLSNEDWKDATSNGKDAQFDTIGPGDRMAVIDGYLQYLDDFDNAVYRVDITSGELSLFVSSNGITTNGVEADLLDASDFNTNGEMAFFDQRSDSIYLVADSNGVAQVSRLIKSAEFEDLYGYKPINNVAGGMTFAANGDLYWTLTQTGSTGPAGGGIYVRHKADGTLSQVLTQLQIQLATMIFGNVGFNDIYAAPDGNIYFYDRNSDSVLYFDPEDPENSLAVYLTEAQLVAGPAGNDYIGNFDSHGPYLTWSHFYTGSTDIYGKLLGHCADFDADGDVDVDDYFFFADCLAGPNATPAPSEPGVTPQDCLDVFDLDFDEDVDLSDFGVFQWVFTGS